MRSFQLRSAVLVFVFGFCLSGIVASAQPHAGLSGGGPANADKDRAEESKISPDAPVITIEGLCNTASPIGTADKKKCRTVVTRSQFEDLLEAQHEDSDAGKNRIAAFYSKFSLLAQEAEKRGMDKDPDIQKKLELARIQVLGTALIHDLQDASRKYAPEELEKFFRDNPALFEQVSVQRVFIPATKFVTVSNAVQQPIATSEPEMKLAAEAIYARAKTGADFDALQKEALETSSLKDDAIVANLGKMTRRQLRKSHQSVFDLQPGEISPLFQERGEGYYIYKIGPKEMPSFESAKSDAMPLFERQRLDASMNRITAPVKLNEEYFGAAAVSQNQGH